MLFELNEVGTSYARLTDGHTEKQNRVNLLLESRNAFTVGYAPKKGTNAIKIIFGDFLNLFKRFMIAAFSMLIIQTI